MPLLRTTALAGLLLAAAATLAAPPVPDAHTRPVPKASAAQIASPLPDDWQHGAFMEIYVRGYQDSDGDGIGDLKGLISRLDYLKDLGITGLWLMPVMDSQDKDHGYATKHYRAIESEYGTLADFDELLKQAHARGIGVVIDYLLNHSAAEHPAFIASDSATRPNPWRDWYVWQPTKPEGWKIYHQTPWYETDHGAYFAGFWNQMPDFNLKNPKVVDWHLDNLRFWLNRGVDGFRFDAVGNLVEHGPDAWEMQPENLTIMGRVRQVVMGYPNRYMVCEAPGGPTALASPDVCGASFAFTQNFNVVGAAAGDPDSVRDAAAYFTTAPLSMATFASNHDTFAGDRLHDQVDGDERHMKLAAATYLLLPGTPFIYYGEEIGMAGARDLKGDHKLRTPMSWTADPKTAGFTTGEPFRALSANVAQRNVAAQLADPHSLRAHYKQVIALRKSLPALMHGRYAGALAQDTRMQFRRVLTTGKGKGKGTDTVWVGFNYGNRAATLDLADLPAGMTLRRRWPAGAGDVTLDAQGRASVTLPARSFAVLQAVPVQAP